MKEYFDESKIIEFFSLINNNKIEYILLRNLDNELPSKLPKTKDIDIIVKETCLNSFDSLLLENSWEQIKHPFSNIPFLYSMKPFRFYNKDGLHIDVCCQLSCRSMNKGEWFPLHMKIQEELWKNKITTNDMPWKYRLAYEDEYVHLMTRCIFDKKRFSRGYIERINYLISVAKLDTIKAKLELVFYKFTETLLELVKSEQYDKIYEKYFQFKEY